MTFIPPDQTARDRILHDLETNLLVEAGAGSGKTTSLVGRMVEHVRSGTPVERLAAVTFTRKAANELRERFRNQLEVKQQEHATSAGDAHRFATALHDLDRAFLGTIHSFCGRILREHPLEAGLDPTFVETSGEDMALLERTFWRRWIDRREREGDASIAAVREVGIDPAVLLEGFICVRSYPDVRFDAPDVPIPDFGACRATLERLLSDAQALRPRVAPASGWDALMTTTRRLDRLRVVENWDRPVDFCRAIESITASGCKLTQNRWGSTKDEKARAKSLGEAFTALADGDASSIIRAWREHRYAIVMRLLQQAARDFERERHATGQLGFEDLLLLTARLLREHPAVRDELGTRFAFLMVDEFQDTDPIQAEVCFLLASPSSEGTDWSKVVPRPGSLFVVGDPKQSIYRFRRADISVYEFVKGRLQETGAVLALTSNFRSVSQIAQTVNAHFAPAFGDSATREQAAYSTMDTVKEHEHASVSHYEFALERGSAAKGKIIEHDAQLVASLIAERIELGAAKPGDFLVLTHHKSPIASYARALAMQNVPATTTGASLPQEDELRELMIVLHAIGDPDNAIKVVAALEGLFFGLSPADLWEGKVAELHFAISHRPSDASGIVGAALLRLHEWWIVSQRQPVDVLVERILDDTGLLFHATSQLLGDARAGALLHIVEVLRAAADTGATTVTAALERLDALLTESLDDISLRPGRSDAVRIMNVHQAKGLEAPIVILAAPVDKPDFPPLVHIDRAANGTATGGLALGYRANRKFTTLAQCIGWEDMQIAEARYQAAEEVRLLYVAATRAERELVVARFVEIQKSKDAPDASLWRPLAPALDATGSRIELTTREPRERAAVKHGASAIQQSAVDAAATVQAARKASYMVQTVTASAKRVDEAQPYLLRKAGGGKGTAWGTAVHRVIEAYLRGRRDVGLAAFAKAVARDECLSDTMASELSVFAASMGTPKWTTRVGGGEDVLSELSVMRYMPHETTSVITEGVIDMAVLRNGSWDVIDWKSDAVDDEEWARRKVPYDRQVEAYGSILSELSGKPAATRVERVV